MSFQSWEYVPSYTSSPPPLCSYSPYELLSPSTSRRTTTDSVYEYITAPASPVDAQEAFTARGLGGAPPETSTPFFPDQVARSDHTRQLSSGRGVLPSVARHSSLIGSSGGPNRELDFPRPRHNSAHREVDYGSHTQQPSPQATNLTGQVQKAQNGCVAIGGYSDIFVGVATLGPRHAPEQVAIKVLRVQGFVNDELMQRKLDKLLKKESEIWQTLSHPNIVPLYGLCNEPSWNTGVPALISPWMENGDVATYISGRSETRRLPLIRDVAAGLRYMHSNRIAHGDLKGGNILVNRLGRALISDFGLSRAIRETTGVVPGVISPTSFVCGSTRWMAPEFQTGDRVRASLAGDVYGFGSTAWQILAGRFPYWHLKTEYKIIDSIVNDRLLERPACEEATDKLWSVLLMCWRHEPQERCTMEKVDRMLSDC